MEAYTVPAVYKVCKSNDEGCVNRRVAVLEGTDGNFTLMVTETYSSSSIEVLDASSGKAVGESEVHPTLEAANQRAQAIHEQNVRDGFEDC